MKAPLNHLAPHAHLFPGMAQELVSLIGLEKTLALVSALGGTTFPVPKHTNKQGKLRFAVLADAIGVPAARKIVAAYSGTRLYIPNCKSALARVRNLEMVMELDTRRANGEISQDVISDMSRQYKLTERMIWDIVNKNNEESLSSVETTSTRLSLWEGF